MQTTTMFQFQHRITYKETKPDRKPQFRATQIFIQTFKKMIKGEIHF